jgi:hypothetical protein
MRSAHSSQNDISAASMPRVRTISWIAGWDPEVNDMKRTLALFAVLATLAPLAAHAEDHMSDGRYLAASRCLAYADVSALQGGSDFTALRNATNAGFRNPAIISRARDEARTIRARADALASSGDRGMTTLQQRRDDACSSFSEQGLVRLENSTPAS